MSYCRMGEDSDVYVVRGSTLVCYHNLEPSFDCVDEQAMIDHLQEHKAKGHTVPDRAIARLENERDGVPHRTDVEIALDELRDTR